MNRIGKSSGIVRVIAVAALMCAFALAALAGGCSKGSSSAPSGDKKAMVEAVANWYAAQGNLDMAGFKAGIYDPDNVLGVATATAPPKTAKKAVVSWKWVGDNVIISMPSQQSTLTIGVSTTAADTVTLKDSTGQAGTFVMKNVGGVWKIDVNATQKAANAANSGTSGSTTKTP